MACAKTVRFFAILGIALLLSACKTNKEVRERWELRSRVKGSSETATLPSTENKTIGNIQWISPDSSKVVVSLNSELFKTRQALLVRNDGNQPVALLKPTKIQRGKMLGAEVRYGAAQSGQDVVLREAVDLPDDWSPSQLNHASGNSRDRFPFILPQNKSPSANETRFVPEKSQPNNDSSAPSPKPSSN